MYCKLDIKLDENKKGNFRKVMKLNTSLCKSVILFQTRIGTFCYKHDEINISIVFVLKSSFLETKLKISQFVTRVNDE